MDAVNVIKETHTAFYDKIALQILNNKAFSKGLIDEKTKINIERQIQLS